MVPQKGPARGLVFSKSSARIVALGPTAFSLRDTTRFGLHAPCRREVVIHRVPSWKIF
jgi:hypothetical protein